MIRQHLPTGTTSLPRTGGLSVEPPRYRHSMAADEEDRAVGPLRDVDVVNLSQTSQAEQHLKDAVDLLPSEESASYRKALLRCNDVVATETNPNLFLESEGFDAWAAAKRLAKYWTCREQCFGSNRAFLPLLNLALPPKQRALSCADTAQLRLGALAKLPTDKYGRTVLLVDRSRLDGTRSDADSDRWLRVIFYWLSKVMHQKNVQKNGFVVLKIMRGQNLDRQRLLQTQVMVRDCMPCRVTGLHLCCVPPPGGRKTFADTIAPILWQYIVHVLRRKANVHVAESETHMLTLLQDYGLLKESLPKSLGGSWSYAKFDTLVNKLLCGNADRRNTEGDSSGIDFGSLKPSAMRSGAGHSNPLSPSIRIQNRKSLKRKIDAVFAGVPARQQHKKRMAG
jgi:hypothetical protein